MLSVDQRRSGQMLDAVATVKRLCQSTSLRSEAFNESETCPSTLNALDHNTYASFSDNKNRQGSHKDVSRLLEEDCQFHAPDFGCRLASELGLSSRLAGLNGSLVLMPENAEGVPTTRRWIKARLARAWSDRALKIGIHKAKSGHPLQEVLPDYREALDLDPTNADAYVGMGAALANSFHWHEAVEALQTALRLQPAHVHAADYLARIKQRASEAGVNIPENEVHRDMASGEADPKSLDGPSSGHQTAEDHRQSSPVVGMDKEIAAALEIVKKHRSRERKRKKEKESRRSKKDKHQKDG